MDKISQKLARRPDEIHRFDNNGQIKAFIAALGLESRFTKEPTGSEPTIQTVQFGEHPTHFLLLALFSGNQDARDNGYAAWCLPKKRYSHEQFMEFSNRALSPTDVRGLANEIFSSKAGTAPTEEREGET